MTNNIYWLDIQHRRDDNEHYIEIMHQHQVIAYLHYYPVDHHYWLESMYVEPEYRQRGLANLLMHELLISNPGAQFRLKVYPFKNQSLSIAQLKRFYHKYGFEPLYKDVMIYYGH